MVDKMSLKLLIDKSSHRVLFAEAGKEVVDFLFGLLCRYYICPLCYSNYNNVVHFTDVYGTHCPCNGQMTKEKHYMDSKSNRVEVNGGGGFVHGIVTYTISDDLTVTAMSTISSITLLNNFNIKDLGSLEESTVELGLEEGLELLKASLQSKTVLTDVFLGKK
uniref:Uncharacterized protein LOC105044555 n=1 Tax=Elaeis guineensis var. tenera TaxID=51953 RepID=A0A8N4EYX3_ELAGV|nr:uncharacterized protein LOC105044555 [Elaeis guineensis]